MACSPVLSPPSSTNSPPSQLPFPLPPLPSEAIQKSHFPSQHLPFHYPSHPNASAQSQTRTSRTTILLLFSHPITTLPPTLQRKKSPSISSIQPTNHVSTRAKPAFPMSGLCHNTRAPDMSSLPTNMDILGWRLDWLAVQFGVGVEDFANEEVEEEGEVSKAVFPVVKSAG